MYIVINFIFAYIWGAIPFSVMIPKYFGIDVLNSGSGNPGFTNVLRVGGTRLGIICLLLDMTKGFLPAVIAGSLQTELFGSVFSLQCLAGFVGVLGHCYSPFLKMKGGKGVAAAGGLLFALDLRLVPILAIILISAIAITKYMSVASMTAAICFPVAVYFLYGDISYAIVPAFYTAFIIFKHRSNLIRLMNGTEHRFRLKK